jgi:hypothetical protein
MPIKQPKKSNILADTRGADLYTGNILVKAALFTIDISGNINISSKEGVFLINPETWEESKSANWATNNIPGQSDPVLQWTHSGARTVSFEALVTKETSYFDEFVDSPNGETQGNTTDKVLTFLGNIASQFFKTAIPNPRKDEPVKKNREILDISNYLNYYRSLLYPTYSVEFRKLNSSPPLVALFSGKTVNKIVHGTKIGPEHDVWVVVDLKIKITKQLPDLSPLEALVTFQLMQYNIKSFSRDRFLK